MKRMVIVALVCAAFYTRLVGISWGLPYPMHPDERNMAVAVESLKLSEHLNPHFFAYGQLPLYLAYFFYSGFEYCTSRSFHGNYFV